MVEAHRRSAKQKRGSFLKTKVARRF